MVKLPFYKRIGKFISELEGFGLTTVAVMCGQALMEHVGLVTQKLEQGKGDTYPPYTDLIVYPAASCAASEDAGLPMNYETRSMEAMMARMGPVGGGEG